MTVENKSSWEEYALGELFQIKHGYAFKGKWFSDDGPYIVLTPGNFFEEGGFKLKSTEKYYTGEVPSEYILSKNDLIVAMTEQAEGLLGSSALVPQNDYFLHNQRLGLITDITEDRLDKMFLYYLFNTRLVRNQIRATASGTKVRHTSPSRIYEVKASLPPLEAQQKIAAVLSAYDDLIENNGRRITILEEMAQRLYREWFVHFRYPGHEAVPLVEVDGREIPAGWELVPMTDLLHVYSGFAFKSANYDDSGEFGIVTISNVQDGHFDPKCRNHINEVPEKMKSYCYLENGDILLSLTGNVGRVCRVHGNKYLLNQRVAKLKPKFEKLDAYIYTSFRQPEMVQELENKSTGVAQQNLSLRETRNTTILKPTQNVLNYFHEICNPILAEILLLFAKSEILRQQRDLLLPRLISGQIDVAELEIDGMGD